MMAKLNPRKERKIDKTHLLLLSDRQNVGEDTVELLCCGRLEEVFEQGEQRSLNRLLFIRQRAAIFLHTVTKDVSELIHQLPSYEQTKSWLKGKIQIVLIFILSIVDVKGSPVVRADGIQNVLDPILPLHALLAFVYHSRQVLHVGFGRKRTLLSSSFSLTFRNVTPICKVVSKKCINLHFQPQFHFYSLDFEH